MACASADEAFAVLKRAADARLAQRGGAAAPQRVQEAVAALGRGGEVHRVARALGHVRAQPASRAGALERPRTETAGAHPAHAALSRGLRAGRMPLATLALVSAMPTRRT